jgi:hypothetical protein
VITRYCGQTHAKCAGLESSGSLANVAFTANLDGSNKQIASTLLLTLPAIDNGGRAIVADSGGTSNAICATRLNSPYMTDYTTNSDCTGTMKGFNIYITGGTGAGQVGLIRAGPDK